MFQMLRRRLIAALLCVPPCYVANAQEFPDQITMLAPSSVDDATDVFLSTFRTELERFGNIEVITIPYNAIGPVSSIPEIMREPSNFQLAFMPVEALGQRGASDDFVFTSLLQQPGLQVDLTEAFKVQDSIVGDMVALELGDIGLHLISYWSQSGSGIWSRDDLFAATDFEGKKVTGVFGPAADAVAALGGSPQLIPASEIPNALTMGSVDASAVSSVPDLDAFGFYEIADSATWLDNFTQRQAFLVSSGEWWLDLSQASRNVISAAAEAANTDARAFLLAEEENRPEVLTERGLMYVSVADDNWAPLRETVASSWVNAGDTTARQAALELLLEVKGSGALPADQDGELRDQIPGQPLVMFATNRNDERTPLLRDRFGLERHPDAELQCGVFDYALHSKRRRGAPYRGDLGLRDGRLWRGDDACTQLFAARLSDDTPLTIFFHGFNNTFEDSARRGIALANDFELAGPLLVWSWPSAGDVTWYNYDKDSAEWSEPFLKRFVDAVVASAFTDEVAVVAHSMGTRMAITFLKNAEPVGLNVTNFVLVAPDYPRSLFQQFAAGQVGGSILRSKYASEHDVALWASHRANREHPVGRGGKHLRVYEGVESIDVSNFGLTGPLTHNHSFEVDTIIGDVSRLLLDKIDARARGLSERRNATAKTYWVLPR